MSESKMAANTKGKNRATFSYDDQKRLMKMVMKYAAIIECKKTDKTTWKDKVNINTYLPLFQCEFLHDSTPRKQLFQQLHST
jgi:hypothetical protein